jgi:hypothetical protein
MPLQFGKTQPIAPQDPNRFVTEDDEDLVTESGESLRTEQNG